ncbi:MAG TPA: type VI secretion system baseplate subunit TssK [Gemmatimonadaceae bacterium]|jgi:type VI secretion system protein ImpJ
MKQLSRVVWNEGMHLAQHHFQAQSRYFEDAIQFAISSLFFAPYGLAGCELDTEAIRNDAVSLIHARGMMPDGLPFDIPASDAAPGPLDVRELFSPTQQSHLVLLTIPAYRADQPNFGQNGETNGSGARYRAEAAPMLDDTTGRDEKPVSIGRKNLRLALDIEPLDDVVSIPIARVKRDGAGHFIYDPEYVPPCVQVGASTRLMHLLGRLIDILDAKSDSMARGRRGSAEEFARQEVASFWLLHAIDSTLPALRHIAQVKRVHPEQLYVELSRLAGALCTFALDAHPRALPLYDHDHPQESFDALDKHIRANLEVVTPAARTVVQLKATTAFLHTGAIADQRAFGRSRWILGVRSSLTGVELAARVPQLAKVCSAKFTLELVRRAFPGLRIQHIQFPPAAIAPRSDTQYFSIDRAGPCWETLNTTHEIGVYLPDAIPNAQVELVIVAED